MSHFRSARTVMWVAALALVSLVALGGAARSEAKVTLPPISSVQVLLVCNGGAPACHAATTTTYYVFELIAVNNLDRIWGDIEYTLNHTYQTGCAGDSPARVSDSVTFENPTNGPKGNLQYYLTTCVTAKSSADATKKGTTFLKKIVNDDLALIQKAI